VKIQKKGAVSTEKVLGVETQAGVTTTVGDGPGDFEYTWAASGRIV